MCVYVNTLTKMSSSERNTQLQWYANLTIKYANLTIKYAN